MAKTFFQFGYGQFEDKVPKKIKTPFPSNQGQ